MKNKFKIAIIGCGRISKKHIDAIIENQNDCELVALCDLNIDKAIKASQYYYDSCRVKPKFFSSYSHMIKSIDIDIVIVATESGYHAKIASHCLENQLHTIVEKPLAMTTNDAEKLIRLAHNKKRKLTVCYQNRFNYPIKKLKALIDSGKLGKIISCTVRILWSRDDKYYSSADWRGTEKLDGGVLMNQSIHSIDILQWLLGGEVIAIKSEIDNFIRDIEMEDYGVILWRFNNRSIGVVEGTSCIYPENLESSLTLIAENGTIIIGGLALNEIKKWSIKNNLMCDKYYENDLNEKEKNRTSDVYGQGHVEVLRDFIDSISNNRNPFVSGDECLKALSIINSVYKASK